MHANLADANYALPAATGLALFDPAPADWDAFVEGAPDGHLLQTTRWAELKRPAGWQAARVAVGDAEGIRAGAQFLLRRLAPGLSIAYVPKGPLGPWEGGEIAPILFAGLHRAARRAGAFMLKVEPEAVDGSPAAGALLRAGFCASAQTIQPRSTIWIDLAGSPEEIRARMKPKTRYNIGLAERKGVVVREGTPADLPAFAALMAETAQRDGFAVHGEEYYTDAFRIFHAAGACKLFLASYEGQLLACLMAFAGAGKAWYFYGASSNAERNRMPTYALQWAAIEWARRRGCRIYDLWGIPDEVGQAPAEYETTVTERSDGLWSVYRFKQGFGGEVVRYVGAYDYIYSDFKARLYGLALRMRRQRLSAG